jgi:hypothetical protein
MIMARNGCYPAETGHDHETLARVTSAGSGSAWLTRPGRIFMIAKT